MRSPRAGERVLRCGGGAPGPRGRRCGGEVPEPQGPVTAAPVRIRGSGTDP
ncbi:hypothetical protein DUI70_2398 [Streptomyces albus]|nr:hypothetical protein DUI70_2398 [Streptomyces albus]